MIYTIIKFMKLLKMLYNHCQVAVLTRCTKGVPESSALLLSPRCANSLDPEPANHQTLIILNPDLKRGTLIRKSQHPPDHRHGHHCHVHGDYDMLLPASTITDAAMACASSGRPHCHHLRHLRQLCPTEARNFSWSSFDFSGLRLKALGLRRAAEAFWGHGQSPCAGFEFGSPVNPAPRTNDFGKKL